MGRRHCWGRQGGREEENYFQQAQPASQTKHSYHQLSMSGAQAFRTMGKEDGEEREGLLCPEPAFHCRLRCCNHQGDRKHIGIDRSCRLEAKEVDGSRLEA